MFTILVLLIVLLIFLIVEPALHPRDEADLIVVDESNLCKIYVLYESGFPADGNYGRIALGDKDKKNYLLGNAAYTNDLGAKLNITYDDTDNMFTVELDIGYDTKTVIRQTFNVRPLNRVIVNVK